MGVCCIGTIALCCNLPPPHAGGDENAVRPIMVAEECLKRGWRSVLYIRRGHGISSLLPGVEPVDVKGVGVDRKSNV